MSRIGRKPITVPSGVNVSLDDTVITVKGPKGSLSRPVHKDIKVSLEEGTILVDVLPTTNCTAPSTARPAALLLTWSAV